MLKSTNSNPLFDTIINNINFLDGAKDKFSINQIDKAIYLNIDDDGNTYRMISSIIYHRRDEVVNNVDNFYTTLN